MNQYDSYTFPNQLLGPGDRSSNTNRLFKCRSANLFYFLFKRSKRIKESPSRAQSLLRQSRCLQLFVFNYAGSVGPSAADESPGRKSAPCALMSKLSETAKNTCIFPAQCAAHQYPESGIDGSGGGGGGGGGGGPTRLVTGDYLNQKRNIDYRSHAQRVPPERRTVHRAAPSGTVDSMAKINSRLIIFSSCDQCQGATALKHARLYT